MNITPQRAVLPTVLVLLLTLFVFAGAQETTDQAGDSIVLEYGDQTVTLSEFDQRFDIAIRSLAAQQGIPLTDQTRAMFDEFRADYLEQRALELVLLDEAQARGIEVTDEDLDAQLEQIRAGFESQEEFETLLREAGFTGEAHLRDVIRETETVQRTVEAIQADIEVTDEEVERWYAENQEQLQQGEEVCARHILVETEEEAQALLQELEGGVDFSELAQEHSTDPGSGARGGDLGCFGRGMMVPPFEEAAFGAATGEVAGPVESQFGFHLIDVYERQEAGVIPLEEVREDIRDQVAQERLNEAIEALRDQAEITAYPERLTQTEQPAAPETTGETDELEGAEETDDTEAPEETEENN